MHCNGAGAVYEMSGMMGYDCYGRYGFRFFARAGVLMWLPFWLGEFDSVVDGGREDGGTV